MSKVAAPHQCCLTVLVFTFSVLLVACGGGGGGNPPPPPTNATIVGTVGGTVVAAFDQSGNEVTRVTAAGDPKTFSLSLTPGQSYRFYLIENEGGANARTFPLYQGTTNVFSISSAVTVDLGFIDTSSGVAVPANNPLTVTGVASGGENTAIPTTLSTSAFTWSRLQGDWNFSAIVTGTSPGWYRGPVSVGTDGTFSFPVPQTDSTNNTCTPDPIAMSLSPSGVIAEAAPSVYHDYYAVSSSNANVIVAIATMPACSLAGENLQIGVKGGGSFVTGDLEGTWRYHQIVSNYVGGVVTGGWEHGELLAAADGSVAMTSVVRSSGNTSLLPPMEFFMTNAGIVTMDFTTTFSGAMTPDKSLMVATSVDPFGNGSALWIAQKASGTFTQSDLAGTWNVQVISAAALPERVHGVLNVTATGFGSWTPGPVSYSGENPTGAPDTDTLSLSLSPAGIVTADGEGSFYGVMSADKNTIICTSGTNRGAMAIFQK